MASGSFRFLAEADQRGTVMTYAYNHRRQLETDSVTSLGGADGTVRSFKRTYDSQARLDSILPGIDCGEKT